MATSDSQDVNKTGKKDKSKITKSKSDKSLDRQETRTGLRRQKPNELVLDNDEENAHKDDTELEGTEQLDKSIEARLDAHLDAMFRRLETKLQLGLSDLKNKIEDNLTAKCESLITEQIDEKCTSITSKVEECTESVTDLKSAIDEHTKEIEELKSKIKQLEATCSEQKKQLSGTTKELTDSIERVEFHGRKLNLVIDGIRQTEGENCKQIVESIISKELGLKMDNPVDIAHRKFVTRDVSKPSPIVARFKTVQDKNRVLHNNKAAAEKSIYIRPDYPTALNERRAYMFKFLGEAKQSDDNAKVIKDRLLFNHKLYTIETIHTADFKPTDTTDYRDDQVRFYGQASPFSNFYRCQFTYRGIDFNCGEQAIMYARARRAYDYTAAMRIKQETNPVAMKRIGNKYAPKDERSKSVERTVIKEILHAKFTSKDALQQLMLSTNDKTFLECNPYDSYYGTGTDKKDAGLDDGNFPGSNAMGAILAEVRDIIRQETAE